MPPVPCRPSPSPRTRVLTPPAKTWVANCGHTAADSDMLTTDRLYELTNALYNNRRPPTDMCSPKIGVLSPTLPLQKMHVPRQYGRLSEWQLGMSSKLWINFLETKTELVVGVLCTALVYRFNKQTDDNKQKICCKYMYIYSAIKYSNYPNVMNAMKSSASITVD